MSVTWVTQARVDMTDEENRRSRGSLSCPKALELARNTSRLFEQEPPSEKRRLLDCLCSNSSWANGKLAVTYRPPFDIVALTAKAERDASSGGGGSERDFENYRPQRDSFRTLFTQPPPEVRAVLEQLRSLPMAG